MQQPLKKFTLLAVFAALLFSGCVKKTRIPADQQLLPAKSKTRPELMQELEKRSKAITTLVAKVELDVSGGSGKTEFLTEYPKTAGILQVDRPRQVRMQILAPVISTTLADMVSDGRQYKVSIPVKNKFIVGDANAPPTSANALMNLRPQHIMDALFVDIQPYENNPRVRTFVEEAINGRVRYYVIQFVDVADNDAKLLEKIWIDRTNLQVTRKQLFTGDGVVQTDVQFSGYQTLAGIQFPQVIEIHRPIEDYNVKITFEPTKVKLNGKLADNAFQLDQPSGSELVQVDNPGPRPF
jgi:outer membrane lipoprotein-sorting protein